MQAPLHLPGYTWDPQTKRFFKERPAQATAAPSLPAAGRTAPSSARPSKRKRTPRSQSTTRAPADPTDFAALRSLALGGPCSSLWAAAPARTHALHHQLRAASMSRLTSVRTTLPDGLPVDSSVLHLAFDPAQPAILRIGTSTGAIATGYLARPPEDLVNFPNDEENWRTNWYSSSKITSLKTCGDRIVATALGQPAQALVASTRESISLASVTLSPRKTSLWTSAISPNLLALGCDRKVLLWTDPARAGQMDTYVTGGNRGDGTVFALDLCNDVVFAGTRKGKVLVFDRRATRTAGAGGVGRQSQHRTRDEVHLELQAPVTHLRYLPDRPHHVVAAGMDGFLGLFDLRFPSRMASRPGPASRTAQGNASPRSTPLLELKGHFNRFTVDLGFDVWKDEWVVAAGQDNRIRLWSLRTGRAVLPISSPSSGSSTFMTTGHDPPRLGSSDIRGLDTEPYPVHSNDAQPHPLARTFAAPVRALAFSPLDPWRLSRPAYVARVLAEDRNGTLDSTGIGRWDCPSLWIGDGAAIEGFAVV